jgi:hypothetical protein
MSISPLSSSQAAAQLALLLQPDAGLAAKLQLGQIVQGQVLRHYEGNRYLVRVLGHEAVVDSAAPLRPNEILHARVTGLKDRIELERFEQQQKHADSGAGRQDGSDSIAGLGGGRAAEVIEELFRRHRGVLGKDEAQSLERAVRRAASPERVALAGLVLHKVGLPLEPALLDSLSEAIGARFGSLAPLQDALLELELAPVQAPGSGAAALGEAISAGIASEEKSESARTLRSAWPASQWILNAQGGGSVAHQVGMLPLELDGADIRVEYALFEDGEGEAAVAPLRHRKLVLVFELPGLGRVEIRAVTAGEHVRVALATDSRSRTNALLRHGEALSNAFSENGWSVDEIAYETRSPDAPGGAVGAAVEHLIAPGSVSRLI